MYHVADGLTVRRTAQGGAGEALRIGLSSWEGIALLI